jgi:quercetin dioxygenase-like cupin family protein
MQQKVSLTALAKTQLERARAHGGRAAETVHGGHEKSLRQTVIALTADGELGEHPNPGQATLQVLRGRVRLASGDTSWDCWVGDLIVVPRARHSLTALEDSVVLLTVVKQG